MVGLWPGYRACDYGIALWVLDEVIHSADGSSEPMGDVANEFYPAT